MSPKTQRRVLLGVDSTLIALSSLIVLQLAEIALQLTS